MKKNVCIVKMYDELSEINSTQNKNIKDELNTIEKVANIFINMQGNSDFLLRHMGSELFQYNKRLQSKIKCLSDAVDEICNSDNTDVSKIREIIGNANTDLKQEISRAEGSLRVKNLSGFVSISDDEMHRRLGYRGILEDNKHVYPSDKVQQIWTNCLHSSGGRLQTALRKFVNHLEVDSGELSTPIMQIASELDNFDVKKGIEVIRKFGQYEGNLYEYDVDNIKAADSAISLSMYLAGENDVSKYNACQSHTIIQDKHMKFLNNLQ